MAKISTAVSLQDTVTQIYTVNLIREAATGVGRIQKFDFPASNKLRLMHIKGFAAENLIIYPAAYIPHVLVSIHANDQFFPWRIGETLKFANPTSTIYLKMIDDAAHPTYTMRLHVEAFGNMELESQRVFSEIERCGTVGQSGTLANGATISTYQILNNLPLLGAPADPFYASMIRLHETIVSNFEAAASPTHVLNIYDPEHLCGRVFAASNLKIPGNTRLTFKNESGANLDYGILCIYYLPVTWTV